MIAQLSCLIFGYIRHTKPTKEDLQTENSAAQRPEYITYFDPIVEFYTRSQGLQSMPEQKRPSIRQPSHEQEEVEEEQEKEKKPMLAVKNKV